jgi:hypothetical protein
VGFNAFDVEQLVSQGEAVTHAVNVGGHGILVTQHSHAFYTVALSKDVPYGQTMERRLPDTAGARIEPEQIRVDAYSDDMG